MRVWDLGFSIHSVSSWNGFKGFGFEIQGLGCMVEGQEFRVGGLRIRVWYYFAVRVQGSGFRV